MSEILNDLRGNSEELAKTLTRDRVTGFIVEGGDPIDFYGTLLPIEQNHVTNIRQLLSLPKFAKEIGLQTVTFAMIRPSLNQGSQEGTDQEIAKRILRQIEGKGFGIPVNLSWPIGRERIEGFYQHVISNLLIMPLDTIDGKPNNRWDIFLNLCTSGGTSLLILNKDLGQNGEPAWQQWRSFIGNKIIEEAEEGTLRGIYGSQYNNIAHGSDSLESVRTDICWMTEQLK